MKKILFLYAGLMLSTATMLGQEIKQLKVTVKDMTGVIFRCASDNETVVEVQSNVPLTFESTMDKEVAFCDTITENGFFFYQLKFTIAKKYSSRKLKIKSYGFETLIEKFDLKAKVPVGLLVIDPDIDVGVGCYFKHLNKGNKFFANTQYADAKVEYYLALECADVPEDNDLSKKIEDAGTALDAKRDADNYFSEGKYIYAKREYEKIYLINKYDNFIKQQIKRCDEEIPNMLHTISGIVTSSVDRQPIQGVAVEILLDGKWQASGGTTNNNGEYTVTVPYKVKKLKFISTHRKRNGKKAHTIIGERMDVVLKTKDLDEIARKKQRRLETATAILRELIAVLQKLKR